MLDSNRVGERKNRPSISRSPDAHILNSIPVPTLDPAPLHHSRSARHQPCHLVSQDSGELRFCAAWWSIGQSGARVE